MTLKDKLLEAAKKTECAGCATEWVNTIFDALGSCETCRHNASNMVFWCIELDTKKMPSFCGHYKPKEKA